MTELARGAVTDRPWGQTLGALGARGLTGQLTVLADGKSYGVAFTGGAVVGAMSPLAGDAAVRVALTGGLVSSTQVADITRRLAAAGGRDEVDVLAEAVRLAPDQAQKLRRRLVAQRAARTFSIDRGDFVITDVIDIPVVPGSELDVRAVIFLGAKNNISDDRLGLELNQLGGWFKMKPEAISELGQYGFSDADKPLLKQLLEGLNLQDLERGAPELGVRAVRAIVYALASCGVCEMGPARPTPGRVTRDSISPVQLGTPDAPPPARTPTPTSSPVVARTPTPSAPVAVRTPTPSVLVAPRSPTPTSPPPQRPRPPSLPPPPRGDVFNTPTVRVTTADIKDAIAMSVKPIALDAPTEPPTTARTKTSSRPPPGTENVVRMRTPTGAPPMSTSTLPSVNRNTVPAAARAKRNTAATRETEALIRERITLLDQNADHFALLGVARDATHDVIRDAYFTFARKLHPDRLAALGIIDIQRSAQRLFAQINAAFSVLNDPVKRAEYASILSRGGESAVRAEEDRADELAMKVMQAEEAFRRGEMAMRRDQLEQALAEFTSAVEMQPNEPEYQAMFVWSRFAIATDKNALATMTRQQLLRAAEQSPNNPTARFFLGRVERILGREREALSHFQEVLRMKPTHTDAASEVRVLESRLKKK